MKDGFRRFGGTFQGNDTGDITVGIIGITGLVVLCVIALISGSAGFVIAGFCWLFFFSFLALFGKGGATANIHAELYREYLEKASLHFKEAKYKEALKLYQKAQRYGEIPCEHKSQFQKTLEKCKA